MEREMMGLETESNAEFIARLIAETQDGLDAERKSETGSPLAMVVLRARLDTLLEVQTNLRNAE